MVFRRAAGHPSLGLDSTQHPGLRSTGGPVCPAWLANASSCSTAHPQLAGIGRRESSLALPPASACSQDSVERTTQQPFSRAISIKPGIVARPAARSVDVGYWISNLELRIVTRPTAGRLDTPHHSISGAPCRFAEFARPDRQATKHQATKHQQARRPVFFDDEFPGPAAASSFSLHPIRRGTEAASCNCTSNSGAKLHSRPVSVRASIQSPVDHHSVVFRHRKKKAAGGRHVPGIGTGTDTASYQPRPSEQALEQAPKPAVHSRRSILPGRHPLSPFGPSSWAFPSPVSPSQRTERLPPALLCHQLQRPDFLLPPPLFTLSISSCTCCINNSPATRFSQKASPAVFPHSLRPFDARSSSNPAPRSQPILLQHPRQIHPDTRHHIARLPNRSHDRRAPQKVGHRRRRCLRQDLLVDVSTSSTAWLASASPGRPVAVLPLSPRFIGRHAFWLLTRV